MSSATTPIEQLEAEHGLIRSVGAAFVAWADHVYRNGLDGRSELCRFLRFFDRFADAYHHGREEDILFRALERARLSVAEIVRASFRQQEEQRRELEPLHRLACALRAWADQDREALITSVAAFVADLRAHLELEEAALFPAARRGLSPEAMASTAEAFARFDCLADATGEIARLRELGRSLVETHAPACEHVHRSRAPTNAALADASSTRDPRA